MSGKLDNQTRQGEDIGARLLGYGVCDSIHRMTTSTGRAMPERNAGSVFEVVAWCGALSGGLLLIGALFF